MKITDYKRFDCSNASPVTEWERNVYLDRLVSLVDLDDLPYRATMIRTGDMVLIALVDGSGRIELHDLVPRANYWPADDTVRAGTRRSK